VTPLRGFELLGIHFFTFYDYGNYLIYLGLKGKERWQKAIEGVASEEDWSETGAVKDTKHSKTFCLTISKS
tara:strand:- start:308 stop:520 length:213 start_codon:yes stop_codon:yes gene_type:complete